MGKSLKGKELGTGITQRKDGIYQGRFVNRFGQKKTVYANTLDEIRRKLRDEQSADDKGMNVCNADMTLDEWYEVWMSTCKRNCRESSKSTYEVHYNRIKKALGWRKLTSLSLIIIQLAINELDTDNERKNTKKVLVDMFEKAIDSDLLVKNVAKRVNTVITKEEKKERRVLSISDTQLFLDYSEGTFYNNLFVLALETGMRIGELMGLKWSDIDLKKRVLYVRRSLCYFHKDGSYRFEWHDTKTISGRRTIPLTNRAIECLKKQKALRQMIQLKNKKDAQDEYTDLVFVTRNNRPTQQFIVQECIDLIIRQIQENNPNFERLTPHCLRHTFATRAIERGMQPKTLQKILGHASLQMTMDLYCHVTDDTLFAEMLKMEA